VLTNLPDSDPWFAWSNFTFIDTNGRPSEVDLLVVAPRGVYLIEIKSYPDGELDAGAGDLGLEATATAAFRLRQPVPRRRTARPSGSSPCSRPEGVPARTTDQRQAAVGRGPGLPVLAGPPVDLDPRLEGSVLGPDSAVDTSARASRTISRQPARQRLPGSSRPSSARRPQRRQGQQAARGAIVDAMDQADIRQSERTATPAATGWSSDRGGRHLADFRATHKLSRVDKRIRLHVHSRAADDDEKQALNRAVSASSACCRAPPPGDRVPGRARAQPARARAIYPYEPEAVVSTTGSRAPGRDLFDRLELFRDIAETSPTPTSTGSRTGRCRPGTCGSWRPTASRPPGCGTGAPSPATRHHRDPDPDDRRRTAPATSPPSSCSPARTPAPTWPRSCGPSRTRPDGLVRRVRLGCLLHLLLSGRPPAADGDELQRLLDEHGHVPLAAAMDAGPDPTSDLVRSPPQHDATVRLDSVADLLGYLDLALEELTEPDEPDLLRPPRHAASTAGRSSAASGPARRRWCCLAEDGTAPARCSRSPATRPRPAAPRRGRRSLVSCATTPSSTVTGSRSWRPHRPAARTGVVRYGDDKLQVDTLASRLRPTGRRPSTCSTGGAPTCSTRWS
jgi:hypothetical protein